MLWCSRSNTQDLAAVKKKGIHSRPPFVHPLPTEMSTWVARPGRGSVLSLVVIDALAPYASPISRPRRRRCMRIAQVSVALVLCLLASAVPARAQTPTPAPTTPASPPPATTAPAPAATTPAPAPGTAVPPATTSGSMSGAPIPGNAAAAARVLGRALTQEEAIGIALETQPSIQARLFDYMAAAHRVDQALSPLLPQLIASGTATRSQSALVTTRPPADRRGTPDPRGPATVRRLTDFSEDTTVGVTLSQVIFDFGKTFASTEAARRLAEQAQEDVELQRQLVTLTVKESFININFARRL